MFFLLEKKELKYSTKKQSTGLDWKETNATYSVHRWGGGGGGGGANTWSCFTSMMPNSSKSQFNVQKADYERIPLYCPDTLLI